MKSFIIGIAGELNSGKDTVASMVNYIFSVGLSRSNYHTWLTTRVNINHTFADRVIHFADPLKDCLSIIYNIPREYFDDRIKKDEEWYILTEKRFISNKDAEHTNYKKINIEDLSIYSIADRLDFISHKIPIIKLRTLMQYFGTNVCRTRLGNNIWVDSIMGKAAAIAQARRICLIPDVRYQSEVNAITQNLLYGGIIKINRKNDNNSNHSSEVIDFTSEYNIDNIGTKMQLFYKTLEIVQDILKK